jgi:hypothetical protein
VRSGRSAAQALLAKLVLSGDLPPGLAASATLRRAATPYNRCCCARGPARRLTAEMVRDTALRASGLLSTQNVRPAGQPVPARTTSGAEANSMSPPYRQKRSARRWLPPQPLHGVGSASAPIAEHGRFRVLDAPSR